MLYIAFDVETPNHLNDRISQIGITVLDNDTIEDQYNYLVDPEADFDEFNIKLTGITPDAVTGALNFPALWEKIGPIFSSGILVAHNAPFDLRVLNNCLHAYDIVWKSSVEYICTRNVAKQKLPEISHSLKNMAAFYNITLDHHNAASDSEVCAKLLLEYRKSGYEPDKFVETFQFGDYMDNVIPQTQHTSQAG